MQSRNYVLLLPESGLVFSANRYFPESGGSEDGLTFVFHHSAAAGKSSERNTSRMYPLYTMTFQCSQGALGTNYLKTIISCNYTRQ